MIKSLEGFAPYAPYLIPRNEGGGYSNDPYDRGGSTMMGITQGTLNAWRRYHPEFPEDVRNLTRDQVAAIYDRQYWQAAGADAMPWPLSLVVFDMAVNSGPGKAVEYLQRALVTFGARIAVDGGFGPMTQAALRTVLQTVGPLQLALRHIDLRRDFYRAIVRNNPSQGRFLRGWLKRADRLERIVRQG